ncbi:MAG: hypothetical protein M3Y49_16555 [Actinomycetota bacterium]|nr:hypothetical protein [Actinomycetota bacterium]
MRGGQYVAWYDRRVSDYRGHLQPISLCDVDGHPASPFGIGDEGVGEAVAGVAAAGRAEHFGQGGAPRSTQIGGVGGLERASSASHLI